MLTFAIRLFYSYSYILVSLYSYMVCCVCHETSDHQLSCSHKICKECLCSFILSKWKESEHVLKCPLCRNDMPLECYMIKNDPVFRYDNFNFKISVSGHLIETPSKVQPWTRHTGRMCRPHQVEILPPVLISCPSSDIHNIRATK